METVIGSVFTGLAALLIALGGVYAQVGKKRSFDRRASRKEQVRLETQFLASRRWGIRCEQLLLDHGLSAPPRPDELDLEWGVEDDDDSEPPQRKTVPA